MGNDPTRERRVDRPPRGPRTAPTPPQVVGQGRRWHQQRRGALRQGHRLARCTPTTTDQYADRHNPFIYFHSVIDKVAACNKSIVQPLGL